MYSSSVRRGEKDMFKKGEDLGYEKERDLKISRAKFN